MEKFPSLENFYTHAVTDVTDNYQVCPHSTSLSLTTHVTVFACDDFAFADMESAVHRVGGLSVTYEFSCNRNLQHYIPN